MLYLIVSIRININISEMFIFFSKSSKSGVYSALTAHLKVDWPHFQCSVATWGYSYHIVQL